MPMPLAAPESPFHQRKVPHLAYSQAALPAQWLEESLESFDSGRKYRSAQQCNPRHRRSDNLLSLDARDHKQRGSGRQSVGVWSGSYRCPTAVRG